MQHLNVWVGSFCGTEKRVRGSGGRGLIPPAGEAGQSVLRCQCLDDSPLFLHLGRPSGDVRRLFSQHLPDDGHQSSHHGNTSDSRSASTLDSFVPFTHPGIFPQHMVNTIAQQASDERTSFFGNRTWPLQITTITAPRSQSEEVRQAGGSSKVLRIADA